MCKVSTDTNNIKNLLANTTLGGTVKYRVKNNFNHEQNIGFWSQKTAVITLTTAVSLTECVWFKRPRKKQFDRRRLVVCIGTAVLRCEVSCSAYKNKRAFAVNSVEGSTWLQYLHNWNRYGSRLNSHYTCHYSTKIMLGHPLPLETKSTLLHRSTGR